MSISFPLLFLVASWFAASVFRSPHVGFCIARQQQLRFPRVFSDTASAGNLRVVNPECGFQMFQETRKHDVYFLKCIDVYWLMMCCVVSLQFSWVRVLHVLRPIVKRNTNIVKTWSPTKSCRDTCCSGYVRTTDYVNSQLPLDFYRLKQQETSKQHYKINNLTKTYPALPISMISLRTDKVRALVFFVLCNITSLTGGIQNVMAFFGVNDATDVARLQSVWTKLLGLGVQGADVFFVGWNSDFENIMATVISFGKRSKNSIL